MSSSLSELCLPTPNNPAGGAPPIKRQCQWLLFLRVVVLSLLLGISLLLQSQGHQLLIPPLNYISLFIAAVYGFTIVSALLLNRARFRCYRLFAYSQIFIDILLASALVLFTGGSQSIFTIVFFLPIISASILLFRRGSLAAAALATLCYGTILFSEHLGYHPSLFQQKWQSPLTSPIVVMHFFAVTGMSFFLVAILGSLLSERLQRTEAALSVASRNYDRLALLYKQIVDDISSGIITVDPAGRITSFNRAAEEITGFTAGDMLGQGMGRQFPELTDFPAGSPRPVTTLTRRDGQRIPVGYSWAKLNMPHEPGNYRLYTFQDLSQIKMLEEQMRQAEKMAVIGKMAAGVAHEFRNPLAAISGAAQVLAEGVRDDPNDRDLMAIIVRECDRLEKSIADFLQFSKPAPPEKQWFSLAGLVEDTFKLLRQARNWSDCCRSRQMIPNQLDCWADPGQLQQVLFNLINNSCLAMGEKGGVVTVAAVEMESEGEEEIHLSVTDEGPGIPPGVAARVFEPFFTTRENGTGLGLAIVQQIVTNHDGKVRLEPAAGGTGTTVIVPLPLPRTGLPAQGQNLP